MSHPDILERSTQTVTKVLCTAFLKSCPISRTPKPNRSTWWTPELGQIRKETRRLYNRAKVGNCQGDWNAYHLGFKIFKKKWKKIWPAPLRSPDFVGSTKDREGKSYFAKDSQEYLQLLGQTRSLAVTKGLPQ
ncbi:hypothetical protein ACLKA6_009040 [Drosophila palustris]